ncbi:MAG: hypothetical protein C0594_02735, partial [Marinilabiliales bacterium]
MLFTFSLLKAQTDSSAISRNDAPNLYLDCTMCDKEYMINKMPYINFVRDLDDADVKIVVTVQSTGSGGKEYSIFLVGQKEFNFMNDIQKFNSNPDDTDEKIREGITRIIGLSMMRYIAKTPFAETIDIQFTSSNTEDVQDVSDHWDSWVFDIELGAWANGEESYKNYQYWTNLSADRVTENWKIENSIGNNYSESRYTLDDETIIGVTRSLYAENLSVKSLGEHWSAGAWFSGSSSSYSNRQYRFAISPAIEYNLFKYSESTRRQLRFMYRPVLSHQ